MSQRELVRIVYEDGSDIERELWGDESLDMLPQILMQAEDGHVVSFVYMGFASDGVPTYEAVYEDTDYT